MSNVLVTGGAGYIGSVVVQELLRRHHHPVVYDNLIAGHREAVKDCPFVFGDLDDVEKLRETFGTFQIQSVMHFAASSLVGESVKEPLKYFNNNVKNGMNLLEMLKEFNVDKIVFSSSAAVYGEPVEIPIREDHSCIPTNPYGETKLIFEKVLDGFQHSYGISHISLRYFNAAGADPAKGLGEDHAPETHLIPIALMAGLKGEPVPIFGLNYDTPDGTCIRDYIHVTDLAEAHVLALDKLEQGGCSAAYNLGNGNGYSVKEVIEAMKRVTGKEMVTVEMDRRPGDPARLVASSEKIRSELGWRPRYPDLEAMIRTAWQWHCQHPRGYAD